jgi:hypothetical protein
VALLVREYHLKPWEVGQLTPEQYRMLIDALPHIAYRENLQMAELMAAVLNHMGGKVDPNDEEAKKNLIPPERLFSAEECLVWFAQTPKASAWTKEAAQVIAENRSRLPKWVAASLPWKDLTPLLS